MVGKLLTHGLRWVLKFDKGGGARADGAFLWPSSSATYGPQAIVFPFLVCEFPVFKPFKGVFAINRIFVLPNELEKQAKLVPFIPPLNGLLLHSSRDWVLIAALKGLQLRTILTQSANYAFLHKILRNFGKPPPLAGCTCTVPSLTELTIL